MTPSNEEMMWYFSEVLPDADHDCDEDGEIPCSICGYVTGMYDPDHPNYSDPHVVAVHQLVDIRPCERVERL